VWALAIVLMVERLVGAELSGIAQLSPLWESGQAFAGLWDEGGGELLREGVPHGWSAVVRLGLLTVVWLLVATWRMPRMRPLSGDD
jgi:hypothetical protein